jgi:hypothetical protein
MHNPEMKGPETMKKEELKLKKVTLSSVKTGVKAGLTFNPSVFCCTATHHCAIFLPPGTTVSNPGIFRGF